MSRCVRATHASSCVAIERLLESDHDAANGQIKSSAVGFSHFCVRLQASPDLLWMLTKNNVRVRAPSRRSTPRALASRATAAVCTVP